MRRAGILKKINNIQALRAYAAVAVVIFHSGYIFPHMVQMGKFGVDIFFVISGYIMALICNTNTHFFMRRRLIRILPLYWGMTILLFVFALIFPQLLYSTYPRVSDLVKSLLFIPYYREDNLIRPLLFVGWSLNYEMLFYVLIWLGLLWFPKRPLTFAAGLLIALNLFCRHLPGLGAIAECYGDNVVFEFLFGILAYYLAMAVADERAYRFRFGAASGLIFSIAGIVLLQGVAHRILPVEWLLMQLLAMLMVLCASLLSQGGWDIRWRTIIVVGDASYVLYLVHPYILTLYHRVVLSRHTATVQMQHPVEAFSLVAVCVVAAVLIHLTFEKPFVAYLNRRFGGVRQRVTIPSLQVAPERGTR
jgi:exopolysaccharide production protein ExoZ